MGFRVAGLSMARLSPASHTQPGGRFSGTVARALSSPMRVTAVWHPVQNMVVAKLTR